METTQKKNVIRAYKNCDVSTDYLAEIAETSEENKTAIKDFLGSSTLTFTRPLTPEEYTEIYDLNAIITSYPEYSFAFIAKTATNRATGHCQPLKKFLEKDNVLAATITDLLALCDTKITLGISCNPYFLIGASVKSNGQQLDSSCHYPKTDSDYASGAISTALDCHTVTAFRWNGDGISGRQLIYLDESFNGMVCGRLYGDMSETDSSFIRKEIYKLASTAAWKKTKDFHFEKRGYCGYLDDSHFIAYRNEKGHPIRITLVSPICPECGDRHNDGAISCCTDSRYICCSCGDRVSENDYCCTDYGDIYCPDCYYDNFDSCAHCGETFSKGETYDCNGDYLCEYCAEKKGFYKCSDCGDYTQDYTFCNDELYCGRCLPEGNSCVACGEYFESDDLTQATDTEDHYCEPCRDKYLSQCETCKEYVSDIFNTCDDKEVCQECLDSLPACSACGDVYSVWTLHSVNPVCSADCATTNIFRGE